MNDIENIMLDSMLREAVTANFHAKIKALPSEEEMRKLNPPSPEHVYKMKKLFRWERRHDIAKKLLPMTKAAVLAVCVATSILFSALMFNAQVRAAVRDSIVQFFELFTRIEFTETDKGEKVATDFVLRYIPDGYEQVKSDGHGDTSLTIYGDADDYVIFFNVSPTDTYAGDTENRDYRTESHNGIEYHIYESHAIDNYSDVVWAQDGYMFSLNGVISIDELLKMAYSLEYSAP